MGRGHSAAAEPALAWRGEAGRSALEHHSRSETPKASASRIPVPPNGPSVATRTQAGERFSYADVSVKEEIAGAGHCRETWSRSVALCRPERGSNLLVARCESVGIVSCGPVGWLAPADS